MASVKDLQDQMNKNSAAWHGASQSERDRLHKENQKLQQQIDSMSGGKSSFNSSTGKWTTSGGSSSGASRPTRPTTTKPDNRKDMVQVKGQGWRNYWDWMHGGTDYSRRPDLAGQTLSQNGVNVTYDKDGYAIKGLHYDHDLFSGTDKGVAAPSKDRYDSTADRGSWGGSSYDQAHFSDADLQNAAFYRDQAQKGNISWAQANNMVNEIRKKYGYTGGTDGSGYKPIEVNVYDPDRDEGQEYQRGTYRPANGVIPGAVPTAGSGSVTAGGRPGGYGPTYGTDAKGDVDYSVLIRDAMNSGADWQTVQNLLNQRVNKAQQNGYYQYMYDDLYNAAQAYIQDGQYGLYQDYMDQMNKQYDEIAAQQEAAQNAAVQQAINQLTGQKTGIEQSYDDLYRQLYIDRRRAEKNLPQQMAAMGVSGGLAEGTALGIQTDYMNALQQGEREKLNTLNDIDQAISDARLTGDIGIAQQAAQLALNRLQSYGNIVSAMQDQQNWLNQFAWQQQQQQIANNQWQQEFDRQNMLDQMNRDDISYDRKLQIAQYLYENTGDASGFRKLGFTDAQIAALQNSYAMAMQASASRSSGGSSGGGSSGYTGGSGGYSGGSSGKTQTTTSPISNGIDPFNMAFGALGTVLGQLGNKGTAASDVGLNQLQEELNRVQDSANPSTVPKRAAQLIQQYYERGTITEETARRLLAQYGISG